VLRYEGLIMFWPSFEVRWFPWLEILTFEAKIVFDQSAAIYKKSYHLFSPISTSNYRYQLLYLTKCI